MNQRIYYFLIDDVYLLMEVKFFMLTIKICTDIKTGRGTRWYHKYISIPSSFKDLKTETHCRVHEPCRNKIVQVLSSQQQAVPLLEKVK